MSETPLDFIQRTRSGAVDRKAELLDQVEYRLAETEKEKDEIYRLRYRAYMNEGAIEPKADCKLSDRFDDLPNSWIFGIYIDGALVSSVRISVAMAAMPTTPAVEAFPDVLNAQLEQGKTIVDPNRFVADPARAKRMPELPYVTLRLAYVACEHFNADIGTATVRAEHQAFYRRVFLHEVACAPRPHSTLTKPLSLMVVDFHAKRTQVFQRYPLFRSTPAERRRLFERKGESLPPVMHRPPVIKLPELPGEQASILPPS
jgi:N-acyl-L-homoserine lactone synthetase